MMWGVPQQCDCNKTTYTNKRHQEFKIVSDKSQLFIVSYTFINKRDIDIIYCTFHIVHTRPTSITESHNNFTILSHEWHITSGLVSSKSLKSQSLSRASSEHGEAAEWMPSPSSDLTLLCFVRLFWNHTLTWKWI